MNLRHRIHETHGTRIELLRHFLPRFFDSDLISSGDLTRVAAGVLAILASSWMMLAYVLFFKYKEMAARNAFDQMAAQSQADLASIAGIALCLTLLIVATLWQSVYPSQRDYLVLAGYPVSGADIFTAKFTAVFIAFAVFALVTIVPATLVVCGITLAPLASSFATLMSAACAGFFIPIAAQGLLLNILPARAFERVLIWMQAALAAMALAGLPPAIDRTLPLPSVSIAVAAPILAAFIYLLSFHRYRAIVIDSMPAPAKRRWHLLSRILDRAIRDPRQQAAFEFLWLTLQRSRTHRLAVLVYIALALAWLAKPAIDAVMNSGGQAFDKVLITTGPAALIVFGIKGLRHLFSIPTELRANWMFQIAERDCRKAWLDAVEKFVLTVGVAPVVLTGALFVLRSDGVLVAIAWSATAFFMAAIAFEWSFRHWRKLPFTCSYLPGTRSLVFTGMLFVVAVPILAVIGWLVYLSSTNSASVLIVLCLEFAVWSYLRHSRLRNWGTLPLRYVEEQEEAFDRFGFSAEGTVLAQEEFQREWKEHLRGDREPILRPLDAGETRTGRLREWLSAIPQDIHYALRLLLRKPGFAVAVVITLSLGLGLNAAFFTIFNSFLLRPLAVADPGSLMSVEWQTRYKTAVAITWPEFLTASKTPAGFTGLAASTLESTGLDGRAAKVTLVSSNYFSLLGAKLAIGRAFDPGESRAVTVLSNRVWQGRYASDPAIIGRTVQISGVPFEVIGVAAPEFAGIPVGYAEFAPKEQARLGILAPDLWIPFEAWTALPQLPKYGVRGVIGRLADDASVSRAEAVMTTFGRHLTAARPQYDRASRAVLEPVDIPITWTALQYSLPLLLAFVLTMLIPCANAANLMLARSMARQREFGARLSLGASRGRLVRQLLTESIVLSLAAAAIGLAVANVALHFFSRTLYQTAPPTMLYKVRIPDFVIDTHVFVYMLLTAVLTTVLFALAPAAQATRVAVSFSLRGELGAFRASRLRDGLVIAQIAACVMLLAVASVLLRGSSRGAAIPRGYEASGIFGVVNQAPEQARALSAILANESWVEAQAVMGSPLNEMATVHVSSPAAPAWQPMYFHNASGDFFPLLRIPILRGRTFSTAESEQRAPVAVISESAARKLWPGEDAVGKTISLQAISNNLRVPRFRDARVIGISRDSVSKLKDGGPRPSVHFPDTLRISTVLIVRGKGTPDQTAANLEAALLRAPGSLHGARVVHLRETLDFEIYPQQAVAWLSTILGSVALLLTITGIYGVMSFMVSQRTKELGIRIALGATPLRIASVVLAHSSRLAAVGVLFGLILAVGVMQYFASQIQLTMNLFDITAYLFGIGAVAISAMFAAAAPTRRACGVRPLDAVRSDT